MDIYLSKSEFELFKVKLISAMLLDNILLSSFCTALRPETDLKEETICLNL